MAKHSGSGSASKRSASSANLSSSSHRNKRQKTLPSFGAASRIAIQDDPSRTDNPSSSAFSSRYIPPHPPPSFATLCARVFVKYFHRLSDEHHWDQTREWLKLIPDNLSPKLLVMLQVTHPKLLSHAVIATYFLRGNNLTLNGEMGVTSETLSAIPRLMGHKLRSLSMTDIPKFSDSLYASLMKDLPSLETLVLRGCLKVGPKTVKSICDTCKNLERLNLSSTGISPASVTPILQNCSKLEVLKIASMQNCTDATFTKFISPLLNEDADTNTAVLGRLKSLKLRHNSISDVSLSHLLEHCLNLNRLDLSFTLVRRLPNFRSVPPIEKLSLTSTLISSEELVEIVKQLPKLRTLYIGALGSRPGATSTTNISTSMALSDDALKALTDALERCHEIENINLVQNARIGSTSKYDSAISYFIERVGRKCKILNFTGLPGLKSLDLAALMPEKDSLSIAPLCTLLLNKTGIDDDAAPYISSCINLETLELAESKVTENGVMQILDNCPKLSQLNLTGCRGISIVNRRRFFEVVWAADRKRNI